MHPASQEKDEVNMPRNTNRTTAAIPIAAMNRRNFIKTTCVVATALAAGKLAAEEETRRAARAKGSPKSADQLRTGNNMKTKEEFKPGDKIPTSGIYDVFHDRLDGDYHAHPHQVLAVAGEVFPHCRGCRGGARFRLHQAAEYVDAHHLFRA